MQAQNPDPPYYGLWSRLEGFRAEELADLVTTRTVVRIANLRSTIHLVTADDCLPLRAFVQPALDRGYAGNQGKRLGGDVDRGALAAAGRALVDAQPRTFGELGAALAPAFPGTDQDALSMAIRTWVPLVQVPPRGVWGRSAKAAHTSAEHWLGPRASDAAAAVDPQAYAQQLVLRYVGAFGPASVADVQKWSGLTRLREVVDRVLAADQGALVPFRSEDGVQLYDLPEAPRPGGDAPAPPRLLAEYDNVLLSHADRTRILGDVDPLDGDDAERAGAGRSPGRRVRRRALAAAAAERRRPDSRGDRDDHAAAAAGRPDRGGRGGVGAAALRRTRLAARGAVRRLGRPGVGSGRVGVRRLTRPRAGVPRTGSRRPRCAR